MLSLPFTLIMQTIGEKGEEGEKARDETEGREESSCAAERLQAEAHGCGRLPLRREEVPIFASLPICLPDIHT